MSEGHNSIAADQLRAFVTRIERLHEERKALADDISDVLKEAKASGYNTAAIRKLIQIRAMDPAKREELEAILELYRGAIGV